MTGDRVEGLQKGQIMIIGLRLRDELSGKRQPQKQRAYYRGGSLHFAKILRVEVDTART
jgi:hypothetical protein